MQFFGISSEDFSFESECGQVSPGLPHFFDYSSWFYYYCGLDDYHSSSNETAFPGSWSRAPTEVGITVTFIFQSFTAFW